MLRGAGAVPRPPPLPRAVGRASALGRLTVAGGTRIR
ncbi:hypothetical protein N007_08810 [Alicyclobacillus acidoterrestris ATCC 49025]|nr:hypothetical protein N007_08810 [Alicyclobacillus acidoterrestris ATCC 49025]